MVMFQKFLGLRGGQNWPKKPQELIIMKKNEKNEKNSYFRSFFGLEARPKGKFRGQVLYTEVLEPLGYRGGAKNCQKSSKMTKKKEKIEKSDQNH